MNLSRRKVSLSVAVLFGWLNGLGQMAFAQVKTGATETPAAKPSAEMRYEMNPAKTEVVWRGAKETGSEHHGTINIKSGSVSIEGEAVTNAQVVIDMASIVNKDVKDPEYNGKLVGHLKNEDFFHVTEFPEAQFEMKKASKVKITAGAAALPGTMTIRGKTQPVTLNLTGIEVKDGTATAQGKIDLDRTKYDVKYNSKAFPNLFKVAADKIIKDEISIQFVVVAAKK